MMTIIILNLNKFYSICGPIGCILCILGLVSFYYCVKTIIFTSIAFKQFKKQFMYFNKCINEELLNYKGNNPFVNIIHSMLTVHRTHSDDLRAEVIYLFNKNFRNVTTALTILKMVTVISPLLGLLGTVSGMLIVFDEISNLATQDPKELAKGIYHALFTTVFGLSVAIPTLVIFYLLSVRMKIFLMESIEYTFQALSIFNSKNEQNNE